MPVLKNAGTGKFRYRKMPVGYWKMAVLSVFIAHELLFFLFTLFRDAGPFILLSDDTEYPTTPKHTLSPQVRYAKKEAS